MRVQTFLGFSCVAAICLVMVQTSTADAAGGTPFAEIPGGPTGVACVGDGPGGEPDRLIATSYAPGGIHVVDETGSVETLNVAGFPQTWNNRESYMALSVGLGDWPDRVLYATLGDTVYRFSKDLTTAIEFVQIPGKPNTHTGITFDRTGVWNFDMILSFVDGTVYRVEPDGSYIEIADTGNWHESPRVIPGDHMKWGAYAGCIATSAQGAGVVYAICPGGSVSTLASGIISAKSSEIRPASGETTFGATGYVYFGSRYTAGQIWGYRGEEFPAGSEGDMFVNRTSSGGITRIRGPGNTSLFEPPFGQHYEGSTFCVRSFAIDSVEDCSDGIDNDGDGDTDQDDVDCQVCGDGDLDPDEQCDDGNHDDGDGCDSSCRSEFAELRANCKDVIVEAVGDNCMSQASIDNGSFDPSDRPVVITQNPPGPYPVGDTPVELTIRVPVEETGIGTASCGLCAPTNLAYDKRAWQSSTVQGGFARNAVDGNTNGAWDDGSVTHTDRGYSSWWQVDLGEVANIDYIHIWNRDDPSYQNQLKQVYIFVSETEMPENTAHDTENQPGVWSHYIPGTVNKNKGVRVDVGRTGRFVKIHHQSKNQKRHLHLAEVEVISAPGSVVVEAESLTSGVAPNTATCTGTVTVVDTVPPVVECIGTQEGVLGASASDNCGTAVVNILESAGSRVRVEATDLGGNTVERVCQMSTGDTCMAKPIDVPQPVEAISAKAR